MAYVGVDIDIEDYIDEVSTSFMIKTLSKRTLEKHHIEKLKGLLTKTKPNSEQIDGILTIKSLEDRLKLELIAEVFSKYSLEELRTLLNR